MANRLNNTVSCTAFAWMVSLLCAASGLLLTGCASTRPNAGDYHVIHVSFGEDAGLLVIPDGYLRSHNIDRCSIGDDLATYSRSIMKLALLAFADEFLVAIEEDERKEMEELRDQANEAIASMHHDCGTVEHIAKNYWYLTSLDQTVEEVKQELRSHGNMELRTRKPRQPDGAE